MFQQRRQLRKGGDVPVLAEIQIRGEVDHKRSKSGDYQEDDCPAAAIYAP